MQSGTLNESLSSLLTQIMKNIFHQSFNAYKTDIEPRLRELTLHHMQCSRKLFEIMLSYRRVSAAYIEGDNVAVTVEGEAARVLNFDTGERLDASRPNTELLFFHVFPSHCVFYVNTQQMMVVFDRRVHVLSLLHHLMNDALF